MRAMVTKDGGVADRVTCPMTRAQALKLKGLAEEAYQPERFGADLSFKEAARRIDALKAEIAFGLVLTSSCGAARVWHACDYRRLS
jgi:Protein of unknown function (DUF3072)